MATSPLIVYFSSKTENTHKFVERLGFTSIRLSGDVPTVNQPYVLITPTYADNYGHGAIPPKVQKFLKNETNTFFLQGVIGAGNRNFGENFAKAAKDISVEHDTPLLYRFELSGLPEDVNITKNGVQKLWSAMKL
tara:strand:+ start:259 stop:663 length:405 start_codon:yes stop_codon:yes gene_type:complete